MRRIFFFVGILLGKKKDLPIRGDPPLRFFRSSRSVFDSATSINFFFLFFADSKRTPSM
uniref:Uncharacterized protein n=1 Tax=Ascaris lumbricoides TaxID=6252 RepID=A0A0M3ISG2_ASCLU